ncbi:MAG: hypothetical protein ACLQU3_00500 [Limisphaerales bacterium]
MRTEQRIKLSAVTTTAVGLVTLLLLAGLLPASAKNHDNQPQYVLQNFPVPLDNVPLSSGWGPAAFGINNCGQMVGNFPKYASDGVTILLDPFLFDKGNFIDVVIPGCPWSELTKINDRGVAVGDAFADGTLSVVPMRVFVRYPDGTIRFLRPVMSGAEFFDDETLGINNEGTIVGTFTVNPTLPLFGCQGFIFKDDAYTVFNYPGAVATFLTDVNDQGTICGTWSDSNENLHGFLRYEDGSLAPVEVPSAGAGGTVPYGLNNRGEVVGEYDGTDSNTHGFILSEGTYTTLDFPNDGGFTEAAGINDEGVIVGTYLPGEIQAFIAIPVR